LGTLSALAADVGQHHLGHLNVLGVLVRLLGLLLLGRHHLGLQIHETPVGRIVIVVGQTFAVLHVLFDALEAKRFFVLFLRAVENLLDFEALDEGSYHLAQGFETDLVGVGDLDCVVDLVHDFVELLLVVGLVAFAQLQGLSDLVVETRELVLHALLHLVGLLSETLLTQVELLLDLVELLLHLLDQVHGVVVLVLDQVALLVVLRLAVLLLVVLLLLLLLLLHLHFLLLLLFVFLALLLLQFAHMVFVFALEVVPVVHEGHAVDFAFVERVLLELAEFGFLPLEQPPAGLVVEEGVQRFTHHLLDFEGHLAVDEDIRGLEVVVHRFYGKRG